MTFSSGHFLELWQCWLTCVVAHPTLTCVGHSQCTRAQQYCIPHPILFCLAALLPTLLAAWWVGMLRAGRCFLLHQRSFHSSSPALCTHAYPEQCCRMGREQFSADKVCADVPSTHIPVQIPPASTMLPFRTPQPCCLGARTMVRWVKNWPWAYMPTSYSPKDAWKNPRCSGKYISVQSCRSSPVQKPRTILLVFSPAPWGACVY